MSRHVRGLRATYRLQLRPDFDFTHASDVLGYVRDLGVSHVYCSPCFQAARGSTHGYDVVDPSQISRELGGDAAYAAFCARLRELGLQQLLDIVPNHMCVSDRGNWRWWDVLEDGQQSPWADTFDIDWDYGSAVSRGRVLLPVLGNALEQVVARGELQLAHERGSVTVRHHDHSAPVALASLRDVWQRLGEQQRPLAAVVELVDALPPAHDPAQRRRRQQARAAAHEVLARVTSEPGVAMAVTNALEHLSADTAALLRLLSLQHYRFGFWRDAATEINYRRFFDINTLAGVRVEDPRVFEDTQSPAIELVQRGLVQGLRIDHVDGLRQPRAYLETLRERIGPGAWLLVEKILDQREQLPDDWPVAGTTGYEFAAVAGGLFVDPSGRGTLEALAAERWSDAAASHGVIDAAKRLVCERTFGADITRLANRLLAVCTQRAGADGGSLEACRSAVTAVLVAMPVYRTYSTGDGSSLSAQDREWLRTALLRAAAAAPAEEQLIVLIGSLVDGGARTADEVDLVLRLQQTCAAVTAKGVEDTAFYRCVALPSLDEVGDSPLHWGTSPAEFHAHNARTAERSPETMLATSTHDTKRSEDVRMRLHVLSEFADRWTEAVQRWSEHNARHRSNNAPDRLDELLLYQTLVGAHPLDADRATAYMQKATREAKRRTSWTDPDSNYDAAVQAFTRAVIADRDCISQLEDFVGPLVTLGRVNALALTLLKLTAPGVPDLYQGTELWDLSLVDPDNRRPVDYELRRRLIAEHGLDAPMPEWNERCGAAKLALIRRALAVRTRNHGCFSTGGAYLPILADGAAAGHVVAYQRGERVITVVPSLVGALSGWSAEYRPRWSGTVLPLPTGEWREVMSERVHRSVTPMSDLLARFPVALLERVA